MDDNQVKKNNNNDNIRKSSHEFMLLPQLPE